MFLIQMFRAQVQVGSFDAGYGASIMSRLVLKNIRFLPVSFIPISELTREKLFLNLDHVYIIGWPEKSTRNVVYDEVLQCEGSRENGTSEYSCSCEISPLHLLKHPQKVASNFKHNRKTSSLIRWRSWRKKQSNGAERF